MKPTHFSLPPLVLQRKFSNARTHARTQPNRRAHTKENGISSHIPSRTNLTTHASSKCVNQKHKRVIVTCHLLHPKGEMRRGPGLGSRDHALQENVQARTNLHRVHLQAGRRFPPHSSLKEWMLQALAHSDSPLRVQNKNLLQKVGKFLDLFHVLLGRSGSLESFQDAAWRETPIRECQRTGARQVIHRDVRCAADEIKSRRNITWSAHSESNQIKSNQIKSCVHSSVNCARAPRA